MLFVVIMSLLSFVVLARSGYCSHHGGVAARGSYGYKQCND